MRDATPHHALIAQGIQFTVLARAFPVLRHDALKPVSNAKLAAAMMQRTADEPSQYSGERSQQLLGDIDLMLDEGVDSIRELGTWLCDDGKQIAMNRLLESCVKLLFTDLLLSGKKVSLSGRAAQASVSLFEGRYVLLCWLLHIVESAPDGCEVRITFASGTRVSASVRPGAGSTVLRPSEPHPSGPLPLASAQWLASHYGWTLQMSDGAWTMALPPTTEKSGLTRVA